MVLVGTRRSHWRGFSDVPCFTFVAEIESMEDHFTHLSILVGRVVASELMLLGGLFAEVFSSPLMCPQLSKSGVLRSCGEHEVSARCPRWENSERAHEAEDLGTLPITVHVFSISASTVLLSSLLWLSPPVVMVPIDCETTGSQVGRFQL